MALSKRLLTIADLIATNTNRVIDVGCDHALLDIYLVKANKINSALAIDINNNALQQAKKNIKQAKLENEITPILNNGLINIDIKADDTIVISGLGYKNIIKIISPVISKINTIIIQSNNNHYKLRKWLNKKGFRISNEKFLIDYKKPYTIIFFKKGATSYNLIDYWLGPILKNNSHFLNFKLAYYQQTLKSIPKSHKLKRFWYKKKTAFLKKKGRSIGTPDI